MKKWLTIMLSSLILITTAPSETAYAQCPMCRISAESNMANGGSAGKGLNAGILYMFAAPYLLVGAVGYIWWRNRRKEQL